MAEIEFHKMHGAGNDFVLIDARSQELQWTPALVKRLADRRLGVGCDQVLVIHDALDSQHRARYSIFNADGSTAGQCGNGARYIALFLDRFENAGPAFSVESPAGVIDIERCPQGYEVAMGVPSFDPREIPLDVAIEQDCYEIDSPWGTIGFGAASMGNPHALVQVANVHGAHVSDQADHLRQTGLFPEGVNVGFAEIQSRNEIKLRVFERGVGETLACGSGACAAVAILRNRSLLDDEVRVNLPGGQLVIQWRGKGMPLKMAGPATHVFKGIMNE